MKNSWSGEYYIVCLDIKCYEEKRNQQNGAAQLERKKEREKNSLHIASVVENCADENLIMSSIILLLSDSFDQSMPAWFGLPEPPEDADDIDFEEALQKALDELNPVAMARKLLAGLMEETNYETRENILKRLENPKAEPPRKQMAEAPMSDAEFAAKANARSWPDKETVKDQAQAEIDIDLARKALEQKFTKRVRCAGCGEQQHIEFHLDPEDKTEFHFKGNCPDCQAVNAIKNAHWDGMLGKKEAGEADESTY